MNIENIDFEFPDNIDNILGILYMLLKDEGDTLLQEVVLNSEPVLLTGVYYDNWDGGSHGHELDLFLPLNIYIKTVNEKIELQNKIQKKLIKINNLDREYIHDVKFMVKEEQVGDWRNKSKNNKPKVLTNNVKEISDIWEEDGYRIFLSHKSSVKEETAKLKERLKKYGISCFVAHEDIHPSEEWQIQIEIALHTMDAFVALLTDDFSESEWTDQEIGFAVAKEVPIISINLGKSPYGFIGKYQALKCSWKEAPKEIAKTLIKKDEMKDRFIKTMETCSSFDQGNELAELLPKIQNLSQQQIDKMISIYSRNNQINESYGFNGKKPLENGYGLAFHLKRITKQNYELTNSNTIKLSKTIET